MAGLIGYARVSTGGQSVRRQVDELRKAGCAEIVEETGSGADRSRPMLATLLRRIRRSETLVVVGTPAHLPSQPPRAADRA